MKESIEEFKKEKQQLIQLGAKSLAELVLDIGYKSEVGYEKIQRAISKPSQNIKRFRQRFNEIKNSEETYWSWSEVDAFAEELSDLLQDVKQGASSPEEGIGLVSDFFESDEFVFEMADDSNGTIGDVYRSDALDLFVAFAKKCKNKQVVIESVTKLAMNDDYGVRDCLIDEAHRFLDSKKLKELFDFISKTYPQKKDFRNLALESLAKQMKDAPLFEKLIRESFDKEISGPLLVEIAEVYFESGNFEKAQSLIDKYPNSNENAFRCSKKIDLQKKLFKATNKRTHLKKLLMNEFKQYYSESSLKELLQVVGTDKKKELCLMATADILKNEDWSGSLALFLIDSCKAFDDAEKYILKHVDSLDGEYYFYLLPIAEKMESKKKYLMASLVYRALLDSILDRGKSKYYYHGIKYLKKLDHLKKSIKNWSRFPSHSQYFLGIKEEHGRKRAFWSNI